MDKLFVVFLLLGFVSCQYDQRGGGGGGYHHTTQPQQPPANILLHKQALGQDGSFNYAFAADNGLQQGEIINPDGSRKGSYSYVDPNGKTITLSYSAGKDGFRVLNGDHLPKAPAPQPQIQQQQQQQQHQQQPPHQQYYNQQPQQQHYQQPFSQQVHQEPPKYPLFRPNPVPIDVYKSSPGVPAYRANPIPYNEPYRHQPPPSQYRIEPAPYRQPIQPQIPHYQPRQYSVQEGNYDKSGQYIPQQYQGYRPEDPRKPHSFGNGYSFEFAG